MQLNEEMLFWLKRRKMQYKKTKKKVFCPRLKREVWEVSLIFTNNKDARYFVVSWL